MRKCFKVLFLLSSIFLLFFLACEEDVQKSLYDPDFVASRPSPIVTSVDPAEGTFSGIGEIMIKGSNFTDMPELVEVFFDGEPGTVMSVLDTLINVMVPRVSGDSILIQVRVDDARYFGEFYPYKIEVAEREYGGITDVSDAYGIAADLNENLYVSLGEKRIVKILPDETMEDYVSEAQGITSFFPSMKMGPNGVLFAARTRFIYNVPAGGDTIHRITGRLSSAPNDFDFDENDNLFFAAKNAVYRLNPDCTDVQVADYSDINLKSIRVYNGYVYVAGNYTGFDTTLVQRGIWRNQILSAAGDLDTNELVFDWHSYYPGISKGIPNILSITFAEDGDLYVGADSTTISDAITVIHPDGNDHYLPDNAEPLFDVLLLPPSNNMCWGSDQYLYVNRRSGDNELKRVVRVTMGKYSAPYYGRQ